MKIYSIKELIPGYLEDGTKEDKELLSFYKWLYNIRYRSTNSDIMNMFTLSVSFATQKTIELFKTVYDIDLTEEEVLSKNLNDLTGFYQQVIIRDRSDALKLLNYDPRMINRIACIYNISPKHVMRNILYNFEFIIEDPYIEYMNHAEIRRGINSQRITVSGYNTIIEAPQNITTLIIHLLDIKNFVTIPETVTNIGITHTAPYILHDNIQYIECLTVDKGTRLPKSLIYLECNSIADDVVLPEGLKALNIYSLEDMSIVPKNIVHLSIHDIGTFHKDNIFKECKYLAIINDNKLSKYNKLYTMFPNLEGFYTFLVSSNVIKMNNLIFLSCKNIMPNITLPEGLLFLYITFSEDIKSIPKSLRVLSSMQLKKKYSGITTLTCSDIKQKYISKSVVIFTTTENDHETRDGVIYNLFKQHLNMRK